MLTGQIFKQVGGIAESVARLGSSKSGCL